MAKDLTELCLVSRMESENSHLACSRKINTRTTHGIARVQLRSANKYMSTFASKHLTDIVATEKLLHILFRNNLNKSLKTLLRTDAYHFSEGYISQKFYFCRYPMVLLRVRFVRIFYGFENERLKFEKC